MAQSRVYSIPALIGLSLPWPSHVPHLVSSWSPAPGGWPGVQGLGLCHSDQWSPLSPKSEFLQNKISCSGVVWCALNKPWPLTCIGYIMIIAGPHAGLISKFTCQQPSQETFITITDRWDYPVRSPSVSLSRASYCLCDARLLVQSWLVLYLCQSPSLFSSYQFTFP